MFRTIVISAFGAGLAVCLAVTALQAVTTEPLILHAETFETAGVAAHDHGAAIAMASESVPAVEERHHDASAWEPADGFERNAYRLVANLVIGIAISLMLLGVMALKGDPIDARRGLLWGIGGFIAVSLLPSLGLPPELPGTPAAEIVGRQVWWLGTAAASAGGIALIVFGRHWGMWIGGLALIVIPHVIGAPAPPSGEVAYPGALAGEFVVASLVVSATLWLVAGAASGWLHQRLSARG
jgi:cobalt transporter subunit CbtA